MQDDTKFNCFFFSIAETKSFCFLDDYSGPRLFISDSNCLTNDKNKIQHRNFIVKRESKT